ncbi:MAG: BCCT family transporter, partial [Bradymonadaceae bacterium]
GVMFVPVLFITFWMSTFGNIALYLQKYDTGVAKHVDLMAQVTGPDGAFQFFRAFYVTLDALPWSALTMGIATVSGIIYFITSSDSASLIIDILTSDNDPNPPVWQRIFWAVTEGAVAGVLIATGGKDALNALQTASVTAAVPFSFVILAICYCLVKGLASDKIHS